MINIFKLSPPEDRIKHSPFYKFLIDHEKDGRIQQNDSYILYLIVKNTFILAVVFGFFTICLCLSGFDVRHKEFLGHRIVIEPQFINNYISTRMKGIAYFYFHWMALMTFMLCMHHFFLYFLNVSSTTDILRFHPHLRHKKNRTVIGISKFFLLMISGALLGSLIVLFPTGLFETILSYATSFHDINDSSLFLLIFICLTFITYPIGSAMITGCLGMLYSILRGRFKNN